MARDRRFTIEYLLNEGDGMVVKCGLLKSEVASFIRSHDLATRANYIRILADGAPRHYVYNEITKQVEENSND